MEDRNEHLLINYFDRTLEEREMREVEELIHTDLEVRKQWQYLQLAVEAVEYAALYDQVAAVRENFRTIQPVDVLQSSGNKNVRVFMRPFMRVAAAVLALIVGTVAYKYFSVSATHVYQKTFIAYSLTTTRGQAAITDIEQAYRIQNWNGVIAAANKSTLTDNKALFLAAMANLQLQQYAAANKLFEQVLSNNSQTGDDYFQDEAQFYLAMSNLADNHSVKAIALLQQIRADKNHLYHQQAMQIGKMDLQLLKIKANR
ncbi:tetratricopeptide repeat protein [Niastella yeongjuensis]|nr:tetratricopeptide repeat protein [Niastella yeongjuensis]SEO75942.1 Tetratricopeptide repeat-containing protein [Niastella yeongjuensis]